MKTILGIESSCDETAAAVVVNGSEVLSSIVSSQVDTHAKFGGVVPEVAAREHSKSILPVVKLALEESGVGLEEVDAVAVTQGPGLMGALLVGGSFAKGLAASTGKPLIPVNHIHAHVHGAFLGLEHEKQKPEFPALSLVVSGGHTNLYYMENATDFQLLGASLDDACGECLDKVAKLFDLGYPGGPAIEKLAQQGQIGAVKIPRMMAGRDDCMMSYSGLKTHMVYFKQKYPEHDVGLLADVLSSFQDEAFLQIIRKVVHATQCLRESGKKVNSLVVAGGVSANQRFRQLALEHLPFPSVFPSLKYCSDNAAMIAALGWHLAHGCTEHEFRKLDWQQFPRYDFNFSNL
ncbi:MAG: tRNA (adenosine(37)-N6)-threonylcarbamoyltransferase complex transferase subunit TsaD [Zetaproteobacteria bacterium]|nr:tRNA (adenosine(37)-N6)-threonylcarbamoyltransferase complex transferase subunit TsaD [Zetaproteobacteria bacterium]